eukprot:2203987-Pyramimonas_sp.AAC.1
MVQHCPLWLRISQPADGLHPAVSCISSFAATCLHLGRLHGNWVSVLETFYIHMLDISPKAARSYTGRAAARQFRVALIKAPKQYMVLADPATEWWAILLARLEELIRKFEGPLKSFVIRVRMKELIFTLPTSAALLLSSTTRRKWTTTLHRVNDCTLAQLKRLKITIENAAVRAQRFSASASRLGFDSWIHTMSSTTPGKLYDFIRHPPVTPNEIRVARGAMATPIEIMTTKRDWWEQAWSSKRFDKQKVMDAFAKARQKALDTDLKPISIDHIRHILQRASPKKAKGCEALSIDDLRRLPDQGIQALIDIYHEVEICVSWLWQLMVVFISLLPKSADDDRAIGVASLLVRLWGGHQEPAGPRV